MYLCGAAEIQRISFRARRRDKPTIAGGRGRGRGRKQNFPAAARATIVPRAMTTPLSVQSRDLLADYLNEFPTGRVQGGERLMRLRRMENLRPGPHAGSFCAEVRDQKTHRVRLQCNGEKWIGACTCSAGPICKHVYAVGLALLGDARSAGLPTGAPTDPAAAPLPPETEVDALAAHLAAAHQRRLKPAERRFLEELEAIYSRCQSGQSLTVHDFGRLGFVLKGEYSWTPLKIGEHKPDSLRQFWLYIACELERRGLPLPAFMAPITDLEPVRQKLAQWRRRQEIERWQRLLGNLSSAPPAPARQRLDLRLRLLPRAMQLELRRANDDDFAPITKSRRFQELRAGIIAGQYDLSPDQLLLWHMLDGVWQFYNAPHANLDGATPQPALHAVLRQPELRGCVVNPAGQPFQYAAEPLRWQLTAPAEPDGDYRLKLTLADGSDLPQPLIILYAKPILVVGPDTVYTVPHTLPRDLLELHMENRIPRAALESPAGVNLLQTLGLELPPHLEQRIRRVPVRLQIEAALEPLFPGSRTEICTLRLMGRSEDGQLVACWDGSDWAPSQTTGHNWSSAPDRDGRWTVYDQTALAGAEQLLAPLDPRFDPESERFTLRATKAFPAAFAAWLQSLPPHVTVELKEELASLRAPPIEARLRLEATEAAPDWFDLRVIADVADATLTPAEIKLLMDARGAYVRLAGKGWRRLDYQLTDAQHENLARLGLGARDLDSEPQRLHALQLADESAAALLAPNLVRRIRRRAAEVRARVTPDVPAGIRAELRPYQRDGFHFLAYLAAHHFGGILADDMGLGKTLQALVWLAWLRAEPGAPGDGPPALVVCPKSVMDTWREEAARFAPELRVKVWAAAELGEFAARQAAADVHVINYTQLRLLAGVVEPLRWRAAILDEGQYIKNPTSQTAGVARGLRAEHRLILTGTPIENRLLDLWSLMAYAMPGALGNRAAFARAYDDRGDPLARRRLSARVRPFLLRRTKEQVAPELPDRIEEDIHCEIEDEQRALYRAELKLAQQRLLKIKTQQQLDQERLNFLTALLRLRQICCHPRLVHPESPAGAAKMEALLELLEPLMEEGRKVLVFSQFVALLDIARAELRARDWPVYYLVGETENRGNLVRDFQAASGAAIFLISLKAGGFGLNLTAANYVVLFDPWWNPAVERQAIDRTHRIGQTEKVIAYRLLVKNSVEEKIRALQKNKCALAEDVLGEEQFARNLTLDDLKFLFTEDAP